MDNMLEHPWTELQLLIKEKWLTQKAFASILWKKVSEVNELLKWKRNITIQRDYLLHQTLWTPIKYWILKQIDYDYSLLDIEESESDNQDISTEINDDIEEISTPTEDATPSIWQEMMEDQITPLEEENEEVWNDEKNDEDLQNRANIFRTF